MRNRGSGTGRPRRGRRLAAAALAACLGLSGCIDEAREVALGDQIARQVNLQLPLVRDEAVNRYVTALGRTIADHSDRPHLEYRFYVVDAPALNAFALPGGHIYVNRALVERTDDVSELAGILAHEIGHVAARHGAENLQRQLRTRSMASTLHHLILGRGPLLDHEALDLGGALWSARHSRRAELEADRLAVRYLVRAGMDPRGMLTLFGTLHAEEARADGGGGGPAVSWFSTHPGTAARMDAARAAIRELDPGPGARRGRDPREHAAFLARLRELPRPLVVPFPLGPPPR